MILKIQQDPKTGRYHVVTPDISHPDTPSPVGMNLEEAVVLSAVNSRLTWWNGKYYVKNELPDSYWDQKDQSQQAQQDLARKKQTEETAASIAARERPPADPPVEVERVTHPARRPNEETEMIKANVRSFLAMGIYTQAAIARMANCHPAIVSVIARKWRAERNNSNRIEAVT